MCNGITIYKVTNNKETYISTAVNKSKCPEKDPKIITKEQPHEKCLKKIC